MNARAPIGFGHEQQMPRSQKGLDIGRQRREIAQPVEDAIGWIAQNAETRHHQRTVGVVDSVGSNNAVTRPPASRTTRSTGWMIKCTVTPSAFNAMPTESTRNGMSSLTISRTE